MLLYVKELIPNYYPNIPNCQHLLRFDCTFFYFYCSSLFPVYPVLPFFELLLLIQF